MSFTAKPGYFITGENEIIGQFIECILVGAWSVFIFLKQSFLTRILSFVKSFSYVSTSTTHFGFAI